MNADPTTNVEAAPLSASQPLRYCGGSLLLLDQRLLPTKTEYIECTKAAEVAEGIRSMAVRGAPLIGIAAAYGLAVEANRLQRAGRSIKDMDEAIVSAAAMLNDARPTAVNLRWALERLLGCWRRSGEAPIEERVRLLEAAARQIEQEEVEANEALSRFGADLIEDWAGDRRPDGLRLLSHCNTGRLATGGVGTALGIVRELWRRGRLSGVDLGETRPYLQGARLSAWEMSQDGIPCRLLPDSAAGFLLQQGGIDAIVVGADRVAANGDTANKVGTYPLAVLAARHGVPFVVALPKSTFDPATPTGWEIPIEQRTAKELLEWNGQRVAPSVDVVNPAFDCTPAELITAFVCEDGVLLPPFPEKIEALFRQDSNDGAGGKAPCSI